MLRHTAFVNLACEYFGRLDVMINKAGIAQNLLMDELRVDDWDNMIDVNIKGVLYCIVVALPVFRKKWFSNQPEDAGTDCICRADGKL